MPYTCFVSHKCVKGARSGDCTWRQMPIGQLVTTTFAAVDITLCVDPFEPGVALASRLRNVAFECLLFVATRESVASSWCQEEWAIAGRRWAPRFVLVLDDVQLPASMTDRLCVRASNGLASAQQDLMRLASEMRKRAEVWGALRLIEAAPERDVVRVAAQVLEDVADKVALAEQFSYVKKVYTTELDELARLGIVRAISATRDPRARELLLHWLPVETSTLSTVIEQCLTHLPIG